jgi:hypothetical protein
MSGGERERGERETGKVIEVSHALTLKYIAKHSISPEATLCWIKDRGSPQSTIKITRKMKEYIKRTGNKKKRPILAFGRIPTTFPAPQIPGRVWYLALNPIGPP